MKKFFYDVCFNHGMLSQSGVNRWTEINLTDLTVGENVNFKKNESYFLQEVECEICSLKTHPPSRD